MNKLSLFKIEIKKQGVSKGSVYVFSDSLMNAKSFFSLLNNKNIEIETSMLINTSIDEKTRMMFLAGIDKLKNI